MDEVDLIDRIASIRADLATREADLADTNAVLLATGIRADDQNRNDLRLALSHAAETVAKLEDEQAAAEAHLAALNKQIDSGEHIEAVAVMEADIAARGAAGRVKEAHAAVRKARQKVQPFDADNHLALLAANLLAHAIDVPIVVRKRPSDAPEVSPLLVLSQTEPIQGYGTVRVTGGITATAIGFDLDQPAVTKALAKTGSTVRVDGDRIYFEQAVWDVPVLANPVLAGGFGERFLELFIDGVNVHRHQSGEALRYNDLKVTTNVLSESLATNDGTTTATVEMMVAIEDKALSIADMKHRATTALSRVTVPEVTSMGRTVGVSVAEVIPEPTYQFAGDPNYGIFRLSAANTLPYKIVLSIESVYEPLKLVAND